MPRISSIRLLVLVMLCLAVCAAGEARADGKVFAGRDRSQFRPVKENAQYAAIRHEQGRETLTLAIQTEFLEEERAIWIFPIRGDGQNAALEILKEFPEFHGRDPIKAMRDKANDMLLGSWLTQVYPFFFIPNLLESKYMGVAPASAADRYGLHAEIVSVDTTEALREYLELRQVGLPVEELSGYAPYCNSEHSLVLCWLESHAALRAEFPELAAHRLDRMPCLCVSFDSSEPWFPMRPTATYDMEEIEVTLYVMGYRELAAGSSPRYRMISRHYRNPPPQTHYFFQHSEFTDGFTYTVFNAVSPANLFTEDLIFQTVDARRFNRALTLLQWLPDGQGEALLTVFFILLFSYISGGLAGLATYRHWQPFAMAGLWNCLSIVTLALVAKRWNHPDPKHATPASFRLQPMGYVSYFMVFYFFCIVAAHFMVNHLV